jgi:hypothetical protein
MTRLQTIISGGQTGADQAGLAAAVHLGLKTGGYMPKGWRTQAGPRPDMEELYGMWEHPSSAYPPRTEANVMTADATLVFGEMSGGSLLTIRLCEQYHRPVFFQPWRSRQDDPDVDNFVAFLRREQPIILNVAGSREESQPGIFTVCQVYIIQAVETVLGDLET